MSTDGSLATSASGRWTVALVSLVLIAYPPLYVLLRGGEAGGFSLVRGDAFLYLTIARNSSLGSFSFDGTTLTNGFHPLWQYITLLFFQGEPASAGAIVTRTTALLSLGCVALGIVATSLSLYRFTGSRLLAVLTVPGVFYLLVGSLLRSHPAWADVAGMESGLSVLFGGVILLILSRHFAGRTPSIEDLVSARGSGSLYLQLGLILPLLVLARLDDVFVVATLGATVLFARVPWKDRIRAALLVGGPTAFALAVYMIHSKMSVGTFLPISGMTKGDFMLPRNLYMFLAGVFPWVADLKNLVSDRQSDALSLNSNLFRGMQVLYPLFIGGIFVFFQRRWDQGSGRRAVFLALFGYIVIKSGYNLVNVHFFHQSSWYHGLTMLVVSFFGILLVAGAYRRVVTNGAARFALATVYCVYVAVASGGYCIDKLHRTEFEQYEFWKARDRVASELRSGARDPKLIAFDDGMAGFSLPFSTIHGFVFAADLETARARARSQLLHHAYGRGHDILTGVGYLKMPTPLESSDQIREYLEGSILEDLVKAELPSLDFKVLYIEPRTRVPFIQFWPRPESMLRGAAHQEGRLESAPRGERAAVGAQRASAGA